MREEERADRAGHEAVERHQHRHDQAASAPHHQDGHPQDGRLHHE